MGDQRERDVKEIVQEVELEEEVWNSRVVAESRSRGLKRGLDG